MTKPRLSSLLKRGTMRRTLLTVAVVVMFALVAGTALAALPDGGTFIDDDGNQHEPSIEAIAAVGITKGCNPPGNDQYCPDSKVSREQMAAFLGRALGLGDDGGGDLFIDDDGSIFEADIDRFAAAGITKGCNPPANDRFCPSDQITRGQMAAFLRRLLDLPAVGTDYFSDDFESIFEGDINALAEEGIGFGCTETEYCPDTPLRREEMAELLVRTFGYDNPGGTDFFVDDESSVFQESINKLANRDITKGCNPPANDEFCPGRTLDRAEMATFLARALELGT